jgi:DNA adenine methylase
VPTECLPFIKWAGGKRKISKLLQNSFPQSFYESGKNYYEPFVGGGALALSLGDNVGSFHFSGSRLFLNDMNPDLVATYEVIRDNVDELMQKLDEIQDEFIRLKRPDDIEDDASSESAKEQMNRADYFYQVRAQEPKTKIDTAARLIFLNKTCFNGLWRVNSKGKFNVPYGHHKNPSLYAKDNLIECHQRLQGSTITHSEFSLAVNQAKKGDLVYFDPPYIPLNMTSSFSQYSKNDFGLKEQKDLAMVIASLTERGVFVILSNSDTPETREIFGEVLSLRRILMTRYISASAKNRNSVHEVIGTNFEVAENSPLVDLESINRD